MSKEKTKNVKDVNWPTNGELFTIKSLAELNTTIPEITLRVKVTKAIDSGTVSLVGHKNTKKGRPSMVLTVGKITQSVLDAAIADKVTVDDSTKALVSVVNITTDVSTVDTTSPTVVSETTPAEIVNSTP